jgi:hypothetical protein
LNFNDEQLRTAVNLAQRYDAWIVAERETFELDAYKLRWKEISGRRYLYRFEGTSGKSLGRESPELHVLQQRHTSDLAEAAKRADETGEQAKTYAFIYARLGLPVISGLAAPIIHRFDVAGALGTHLLVVGTVAMAAYELEAREAFAEGRTATEDADFAWTGGRTEPLALGARADAPVSLLALLKQVDSTYTVNTECTFQARNRKGEEVEFLTAPSVTQSFPRHDRLSPLPLPEQEWLLAGRPLSHVAASAQGYPARLVVPDPRWFALHKLWLADKPTRSRLKADKDRTQGTMLLNAVVTSMPHYPLDEDFAKQLPKELGSYLLRWRADRDTRKNDREFFAL